MSYQEMNEAQLQAARERHLEKARTAMRPAKRADRNLRDDERRDYEKHMREVEAIDEELRLLEPRRQPIGLRSFETGETDEGDDMEGDEIRGVSPDGETVRSFGPGESIYEYRKQRGDYDGDVWDDVHIGTYLRAREFGAQTPAEKRALDSVSAGAAIPQPLADQVVDDIREASLLGRTNIRSMRMDSNTLDVARFDSAPSGAWLAEGSTFSSTDPAISSVQLNARTYRAKVKISRESFDDSVGLDEALRTAFRQDFAGALNDAILVGNPSSTDEPTGIAHTTDIPTTAFGGSTGGTRPESSNFAWDEVIRARQQLLDREVPAGALSGVWSPKASRLFNSLKDANHQPLQRPGVLRDLAITESVASPTTLSSTNGNAGMELTLGDMSNVVVGVRLDPEIRVIDSSLADSWEMSLIAGARWDIQFLQPDALERLRPITT